MPSTARTVARETAARPGAFGLVFLAVLLEGGLRTAIALVDPFVPLLTPPVLALLAPPFVLGAFGSLAYLSVRDGIGVLDAAATLRRWWTTLLPAIVVAHAAALALGTALFLVLDTAVRAALYALGRGDVLSLPIQVLAPLLGVAACTYAVYALLVPGVDRLLDGGTIRDAAGAAATAPFAAPVSTLGALAAHLAAGVGAAALAALGIGPAVFGTRTVQLYALFAVLSLAVLAVATWLLLVYHAAVDGVPAAVALGTPVRPSAGAVAVALLLVGALVAGAVAVRATETRPGGGTAPLPDDPDAAYATALANTAASSYHVRARLDDPERNHTQDFWVDDANRRLLVARDGGRLTSEPYASAGTAPTLAWRADGPALATWEGPENRSLGGRVAAAPGYWVFDRDAGLTGLYALPDPERLADADGWTVVDESDGERTLELAGRAACRGLNVFCLDPDATVHEAVVRVAIDEQRGVLTGGEATIDASVDGERTELRRAWTVETGVTVERPADLGDPRLSELVWKVFAY